MLRGRPAGTSVYKPTTSIPANVNIWIDGIAHPPQPACNRTPNGLGRVVTSLIARHVFSTSWTVMNATTRCRKRRSTSNESSIPTTRNWRTHHELAPAITLAAVCSPGAPTPLIHRTIVSSATVTGIAAPLRPSRKTTSVVVTTTATATNQPSPVVRRW